MKICAIGNRYQLLSKELVELVDVNDILNKKHLNDISEVEIIILQTDEMITEVINILQNRYPNKIIIVYFEMNDFHSSYSKIKDIINENVVLMTQTQTEYNNRWLIETKTGNEKTKNNIEKMINTLHYNIKIQHKRIQFLEKGSLEILFRFNDHVQKIIDKTIIDVNSMDISFKGREVVKELIKMK